MGHNIQINYTFVSICIVVIGLFCFYANIERKIIKTRRMIVVAVMTALCIVGRFVPFFKPIIAFTILTGIYVGSDAAFLVGSLSAFISNFYFGQGPWTPFQMMAFGLIGVFSSFISKYIKHNKFLLLSYGFISGIFFSFIMDIWTVLWYNNGLNLELYLAALITAIPYTLSYGISNVIFLSLCGKSFGEKLERVKKKYGI
ncbi:MAG: ECF transporter S component [Eubacteriales bacterium]|nr:ECF transporter S component [Eubacteriales bacterium]